MLLRFQRSTDHLNHDRDRYIVPHVTLESIARTPGNMGAGRRMECEFFGDGSNSGQYPLFLFYEEGMPCIRSEFFGSYGDL